MQGQTFRKLRRTAAMTATALLVLAGAATSGAYTGNTEPQHVQKPPTTGVYAYGVYGPNVAGFPKIGPIYDAAGDPTFGGTVRRITSEFPKPSKSDIYSKNGFWSADGKLMYHLNTLERKTVINTASGVSVELPGTYKGFDGSFAPTEPVGGLYTWYFFSDTKLMMQSITSKPALDGAAVVVRDFGATVGPLGGSVDWIDSSGQYMVLNIGGVLKVWDRVKKVLYADPQPAAVNANAVVTGGGWIGISPDGQYVVVSTDDGSGTAGSDQQISYAIDHANKKLRAGKLFWTLCGGHGDLVTAGDSRTYLVTFDCYGSRFAVNMLPAIYAVDVDPIEAVRAGHNPDDAEDEKGRNLQRTNNRKLFEVAWGDDGHFSGASMGPLRDWAFISIESGEDTFGRTLVATKRNPAWWTRPYMQEIVMVNVVTCQVVRVAHHRSRSVNNSYYYQPRVSATWDGTKAGWLSNFGQLQMSKQGGLTTKPYPGYADVYAIDVSPTNLPATATVCLP